MLNASNPLANWLWKDLFVWPQGRFSPAAYLGALFRIAIVYIFSAQVLSILAPSLLGTFNSDLPVDMSKGFMWGQIGAIVLIAFPVWSTFQRRINDMRPDIREKLKPWNVAFPLIFIGLIAVMIAHALGLETAFDGFDLNGIHFWFAIMLFGAAFVPGGGSVPDKAVKNPAEPFQNATQRAAREALAGQLAAKPAGRHLPTAHVDRPKPSPATNFPQVIQRTRNLPQDGRVKPGWFS